MFRRYWLAEQGLAPKRVILVVVPLIIIFLMELVKRVLDRRVQLRNVKR